MPIIQKKVPTVASILAGFQNIITQLQDVAAHHDAQATSLGNQIAALTIAREEAQAESVRAQEAAERIRKLVEG